MPGVISSCYDAAVQAGLWQWLPYHGYKEIIDNPVSAASTLPPVYPSGSQPIAIKRTLDIELLLDTCMSAKMCCDENKKLLLFS